MIALDQLSSLGIGTSRIASLGNRRSPDYFSRMLSVAAENGVNVIDTADTYGSGDAERLIGNCIETNRSAFFVITKAGIPYADTPEWLSPLNQIGKKVKAKLGAQKDYTPAYLVKSLRRSLNRLGVEQVDAFLLHEPEWSHLANVDAWSGLATIKQMGLARYTGVSTNDYRVVEAGINAGQVQLVQTSTAWNNSTADAIINLCRQGNIPVVANTVLQSVKALTDQFSQNLAAIHQLKGLDDVSLIQLLIAAVLAQKQVQTVLIGTTDLAHMTHNLGALRYRTGVSSHLSTINQLLL